MPDMINYTMHIRNLLELLCAERCHWSSRPNCLLPLKAQSIQVNIWVNDPRLDFIHAWWHVVNWHCSVTWTSSARKFKWALWWVWQFPTISLRDLTELSISIFGVHCIKWMVYVLWARIVYSLLRGKMWHMWDLRVQRTVFNNVPNKGGLLEQKVLRGFPGESLGGGECKLANAKLFEAMSWGVGHCLLITRYVRPGSKAQAV